MKILKYIGISAVILGALFATAYFIKTNNKSVIEYDTESATITNIEKKTVVTGKVIPEDEEIGRASCRENQLNQRLQH